MMRTLTTRSTRRSKYHVQLAQRSLDEALRLTASCSIFDFYKTFKIYGTLSLQGARVIPAHRKLRCSLQHTNNKNTKTLYENVLLQGSCVIVVLLCYCVMVLLYYCGIVLSCYRVIYVASCVCVIPARCSLGFSSTHDNSNL